MNWTLKIFVPRVLCTVAY